MSFNREAPEHEAEIVWEEDISELRYVREVVAPWCRRRQGAVPWRGPGRRVGYSVLKKDAPNNGELGIFTRRIFWLRDNDLDVEGGPYCGCGAPAEGVDPYSVRPGVPGEQNERAWGGPLRPVEVGRRERESGEGVAP